MAEEVVGKVAVTEALVEVKGGRVEEVALAAARAVVVMVELRVGVGTVAVAMVAEATDV